MKTRILSIICLAMLFTGCTKPVNESVYHNDMSVETARTNTTSDNTMEGSAEASPNSEFPPEGITAPIIMISSTNPEYETGKKIVPGSDFVDRFKLDGIEYVKRFPSCYFVIEDDGNIVVEGEPEFEDDKIVRALRELYSLEYVGETHKNEHLFRFGDDILAIGDSPAAKIQSVYFKDSDYDESQFYYAYIFEAYKPHGVFPPEGINAPITTTPSTAEEYEPGKVLYGKPADRFYLEDVEYIESVGSYFGFVIEDDGNIVVEGEPEFEDNETVQALRELYSLEYVGLSHTDEHLFRYGDDLLAIVNFPEAMKHSVYFMDSGYDESQYYCARFFEPR
ncbi:MAG: hypothetical protein K2G60_02545 [Oscillospiraceae bacterium]|nr:hypothetical protein [Oscillospiraceae bacterium]